MVRHMYNSRDQHTIITLVRKNIDLDQRDQKGEPSSILYRILLKSLLDFQLEGRIRLLRVRCRILDACSP